MSRLTEIEERLRAVTRNGIGNLGSQNWTPDRLDALHTLQRHAPADIEYLLGELRRLREELRKLRDGETWLSEDEVGLWASALLVHPDPGEEARREPNERFPHHVEGCICPRFADIAPSLIADMACPVHGVNGTDPGDVVVPDPGEEAR